VKQEHVLPTVDDTRALGEQLAEVLRPGDLVVLVGPLGAGKTALTQGIGAGLGVREPVTSPTFVIARVYRDGRLPLVHVDAYRLGGAAELEELGLREARADGALLLVEWGEPFIAALGGDALVIALTAPADPRAPRAAEIEATGPRSRALLASLARVIGSSERA
jgi:tRNA threonylcarbamoyladenosine biosynthesis protein TsaE